MWLRVGTDKNRKEQEKFRLVYLPKKAGAVRELTLHLQRSVEQGPVAQVVRAADS